MSEKHTPGPWKTERHSATIAIRDANDKIIGEIYGSITRPEREWHANARLIAACPTMYDYIRRRAEEGDEDAVKIIAAIG
jgi:hypothetical protein